MPYPRKDGSAHVLSSQNDYSRGYATRGRGRPFHFHWWRWREHYALHLWRWLKAQGAIKVRLEDIRRMMDLNDRPPEARRKLEEHFLGESLIRAYLPKAPLPGKHACKLTVEDVQEIRRCWAEGKENNVALAERFGVTRSTITCVVYRKSWKDVP